jgi:hypothetical protein
MTDTRGWRQIEVKRSLDGTEPPGDLYILEVEKDGVLYRSLEIIPPPPEEK